MSYGKDSSYGQAGVEVMVVEASRGFNRGSPGPKPVEVGKEYEVVVTDIVGC